MKILLVTQDEPFFLYENIKSLIEDINKKKHQLVGCILLSPSPYGNRKSFLEKSKATLSTFGLNFFLFYSIKFVTNKLLKRTVKNALIDTSSNIIELDRSINHFQSLKKINSLQPDLIISILGNEIFKKDILNLPTYGCINLHTSLLPKYRGMMPTFWALLNNERYIGVSVFIMDEGIDSGKIIIQEKVNIEKNDTQRKLIIKTKKIGIKLISKAIDILEKGDDYVFIDNIDSESSYFSMPSKKDVKRFKKSGKKLV